MPAVPLADVRVAARVLHAPWYAGRPELLARELEALGPDAAADFGASFEVVEDTRREGVWPAVVRGWSRALADADATHVLLMEDDFLPSKGFALAVRRAVALFPEDPISVWVTGARAGAHYRARRWFTAYDGVTGGSVVLPRALCEDFLSSIEGMLRPGALATVGDLRLHAFLVARRRRVVFTPVPFQEHFGAASTLGHNVKAFKQPEWPGADFDLDALPLEALAREGLHEQGMVWPCGPHVFDAAFTDETKALVGWAETRASLYVHPKLYFSKPRLPREESPA
jgi:hypothetical protein